MRIACRRLSRDDRKVLRWVLAGASFVEVGRRLGVGRTWGEKRANGVLWLLRTNAALAEYLGVAPESEVKRDAQGRAASIANVPPARRLAM